MRDLVRGVAIGIALLLIVGAIATRAGGVVVAVPRTTDVSPWLIARASGFAAFAALSLDTIVGLVVSTRVADARLRRGQLIELHGWLSPIALALVVGHALALLADSYIRFDALDVLIPFAAPYRPAAVGIGVLAAYAALVVHTSFAFRKRLGTRTWRRLHYLSFFAFAGSATHGILGGTDAARPWAIAVYAAPLLVVVALVAVRGVGAARRRSTTSQPNVAAG